MGEPPLKPVAWVGSSRRDIQSFPERAQKKIGDALQEAQYGIKPASAKPLTGFGSANVLEIRADHDSDTYRAVYTVRFAEIVYVLHAFQKKSLRGIETSQRDVELIRTRLRAAQTAYSEWLRVQQKDS